MVLATFYTVVYMELSRVKKWPPGTETRVVGHHYQPDRSLALPEGDVEFYINSISNNGIYKIYGWVICTGVAVKRYECRVLFYHPQKDEFVSLATQMVGRADVNESINARDHTDIDYSGSGFLASCDAKKLPEPIEQYQLFLQYESNDLHLLVDTGMGAV